MCCPFKVTVDLLVERIKLFLFSLDLLFVVIELNRIDVDSAPTFFNPTGSNVGMNVVVESAGEFKALSPTSLVVTFDFKNERVAIVVTFDAIYGF